MNDIIEKSTKGRKKAVVGEVRVYSNQKFKKTPTGWELLKDIHRAKSDGHQAHVHTVSKDKVYYHVHDHDGNKIANGKMSHSDFKHNYEPVVIHYPQGGSPDSSHVIEYTDAIPTVVEGEVVTPEDDEIEEEVVESPSIIRDDDDDDFEQDLDDTIEPDNEVGDEDEDELEEISIDPYNKRPILSNTSGKVEEGQVVRFLSDGVKREGVVKEIAHNGILTIGSGSRIFYISPGRLI